jgi:hypothetical protein
MDEPHQNGLRAFDTLQRYLGDKGWSFERIKDDYALRSETEGELCPLTYYFQIKLELEQFLFYIVPKITLLKDMLHPAAEYICRANFGLRIGDFELDYRDGQVQFKSSINFKGVELDKILIDNTIAPALTAFEEFFPGLANVIAGLETPAKAIRKAEYGT